MTDLTARLALKRRLPRTWPAFFERHGNFTTTQLAAIPALLDGRNVMLCAPTASGKTEAVIAPLIERHCPPVFDKASRSGPLILYLTPTRALASDLATRLKHPLDDLRIALGIKTGDVRTFRPDKPPVVLVTTPEALDSLLASHARLLAALRAIVIDEVHLFDGSSRGDHARVLLNRIRRIKAYAHNQGGATAQALQYAALSATVGEPGALAARYFDAPTVIAIGGARMLDVEWLPLAADGAAELLAYFRTFRGRGWRKALAFCNSRAEVEAYAAALRSRSPFGNAVYVHYSNIDPRRRQETEQHFARDDAAICVASSTLELGIDVGTVDVVLLIGPPGSPASFLQRIGRGSRRRQTTAVACCYRSPLERLIFEALIDGGDSSFPPSPAAFRPAIVVQQIFSLIKQSPTAAIRLAELAGLFEGMLGGSDLQSVVAQLQRLRFLKVGRPGEWRAADRLNQLFDEQISAHPEISIHSNVQASDARLIEIRDRHTGQTIARVDAQFFDRPVLTVEGRPISVERWDGEALWISSYRGEDIAGQLRYRSARQPLSYELARRLPLRLGLTTGAAPLVQSPGGWWCFHWLGDVYGRAALDLLRYTIPAKETRVPGLCIELPDELPSLTLWAESQVIPYLEESYRRFEPMLALGPFHSLLPTYLRRRTVVEQFDVARFLDAWSALRLMRPVAPIVEDLSQLVTPFADLPGGHTSLPSERVIHDT